MEPLINYLESVSNKIAKDEINFKKSPKDRLCKEYIEGRLDILDQLWLEYLCAHKELMTKHMPKELDATSYIQNEVFELTSEKYLVYKCLLKKELARYVDQSNISHSGKVDESKTSAQVKLPKINISPFSGKYTEWPTFRDMFRSMIHNNNTLDDVQKLHYLKGYVTGDAEQLLRHIKITQDNYNRCWQLLEQTYDNKKYISHHIMKTLFNLKPIMKESSAALKEMINTTNDCLADLLGLGIDVSSWDTIIIYLLVQKLDPESKRQWEFNYTKENSSTELPTYSQFKEFVANRAIECLESDSSVDKVVHKIKSLHVLQQLSCPFCSEEHKLSSCTMFMKESVDTRRDFVQNHYVCFNCLGSGHTAKLCRVRFKCRLCNSKHHTTLHPVTHAEPKDEAKSDIVFAGAADSSETTNTAGVSNSSVTCFSANKVCSQVLLPTALVYAESRNNEKYIIRALLDQGSQTSFVTEAMVQYLGLKKIAVVGQVTGIGGDSEVLIKSKVEIRISSLISSSYVYTVEAYVLRSITALLPSGRIDTLQWTDLVDVTLADPNYHTPNHIDILLGAEIYGQILESGIKKHPSGSLLAQATSLGWILSGTVEASSPTDRLTSMHCTAKEVDNEMLKQFWELEADNDLPKEKILTAEEILCEQIYQEPTTRNKNGRYVVRLPFKEKNPRVDHSLSISGRRFKSLKRSNLRPLKPFFDDEQLLRVGGRLENSLLEANRKHPIILPKVSYLTQLVIMEAHTQTLHGGIQLLLSYIQTKFWIPGAKQLGKTYLSKCVKCAKNSARTVNPLMGQLPSSRVTPSRPFYRSGVDYAGPIQIRTTKGRGHKAYKGYICLFVCMATRAVHLEAVSDLTTEGFLQSFKRFVSRRGRVSELWSDNGTNFVGADRELKTLVKEEISNILPEVAETLASQDCEWHFIPPLSPNFGGLWEAGVKSVKHHLKRTIGASTLTFEEMTTLLSQVEAYLNSRPISVIADSDSAEVLTPGHFLIGEPLLTAPDRNYETFNVSSLRRWQHTQRMLQIFWKKWSQDYLNQFFRRYKWSTQTLQPKEGDVVVIKEDGLPLCRWLYGAIHELHPGFDKVVRVVTLKTKNGFIKRPVSKLCFLPLYN